MNATAPDVRTFAEFFAEEGRVPMFGDAVPPWRRHGWLLFYVIAGHAAPNVQIPDRWGYLAELKHGRDPGPIPPVDFQRRDPAVPKMIEKQIAIAGEYGARGWGWEAFRLWIEWLAFGLGVQREQPDLVDAVQEKLYRTFDLKPWLEAPHDYLGEYAAEKHAGGWNPNAFYPTPHSVVDMMTRMTFAEIEDGVDGRWRTAQDCCCGTGRFLLHAGNHVFLLYGQDIDGMMVTITKINGALYVPWLVCPPTRPTAPPADVLDAVRRARELLDLLDEAAEPEAPADTAVPVHTVGAPPAADAVPFSATQLSLFGGDP